MMVVDATGRVDNVELTALGDTHGAVEDCLRVEALAGVEVGEQVIVHPPDSVTEGIEVEPR